MLVPRLISRNLLAFSNMRKVGKHLVPELPTYKLNPEAMRPYAQNEQGLDREKFYNIIGHQSKTKNYPQCRYFAVQYKNRVHHVFNAYYYPMGRMIEKIATAIRGRNSPLYKNSQADIKNGDVCIIVNALDPLFTGKKLLFKNFKYHTGFVGNLKTFSYRSVLNKKPELLYYYLLRKAMPKNKVSEKYFDNVKIYRGPTHDIPNIPQFAPEKLMMDSLTEMDLQKYAEKIREEGAEVLFEADEEGSLLGKQIDNESKSVGDDIDDSLATQQKMRRKQKYTPKEMEKFERMKKRIIQRYKTVRAPYKKKQKIDPGFEYFDSEKKARKSPYYDELADEDLPEVDDQLMIDPLKRKGFDKD